MAVKIRLKRMGAKKKPFYRVVVADSRSPRDGRFIEELGWFDPLKDPAEFKLNVESARDWIGKGAQPTDTARALLKKAGVYDAPVVEEEELGDVPQADEVAVYAPQTEEPAAEAGPPADEPAEEAPVAVEEEPQTEGPAAEAETPADDSTEEAPVAAEEEPQTEEPVVEAEPPADEPTEEAPVAVAEEPQPEEPVVEAETPADEPAVEEPEDKEQTENADGDSPDADAGEREE